MIIKKTVGVIKEHIKNNKFTYLSLFLLYITGIVFGAFAVNDMDFQQLQDISKYFNGFLKLFDSSQINQLSLFKISILDNIKVIVMFWLLGFTVIGFPLYYIVICIRGFCTGFSSGVIMGILGAKGIMISSICFLPKEIIIIPCLIAIGANGIKLSRAILRSCIMKTDKKEDGIKQRIIPYSFVTLFFSIFIFAATLFDAFISPSALKILNNI